MEVAGQWDLGIIQRPCVSCVVLYPSLVRRKHQNGFEDVRPSCPGPQAPGHSPLMQNVCPQEALVAGCPALAPSLPEESVAGQMHPWGLLPALPPRRGRVFPQGPQSVVWGEVVPVTCLQVSVPGGPGTDTLDIINGKETQPGGKGNFSSVNREVLLISPDERQSAGADENRSGLTLWRAGGSPACRSGQRLVGSARPWSGPRAPAGLRLHLRSVSPERTGFCRRTRVTGTGGEAGHQCGLPEPRPAAGGGSQGQTELRPGRAWVEPPVGAKQDRGAAEGPTRRPASLTAHFCI